MQNVMNTQITNVAAMQEQTEMFAKQIDQEMEMLHKEVIQSFALSAKAEKTAKNIPNRQGKEVPMAISAKDIEWQAWFEELAEQVAKLLKAEHLDAETMAEVTIRIANCLSTALPVREKVAEAASPMLPPSPLTGSHHECDPSRSPLPQNNDEEGRQSLPPRHRWYYTPEYSADDRPELEVMETSRDVCPSNSQIVLVMKENKQLLDEPKLFSGKTTDQF
jgi:hypothetical protein